MKSASRRTRASSTTARLSVVAGGTALGLAAAMLGTPVLATSMLTPWTRPVNLSSSGGHSPDLAVSADGTTAVAVWLRKKDGHRVVQARVARLVNGAVTWSPKQDVSAVAPSSASSPSVAVSGDGDTAIVVWTSGWTSVRARTAHISKGNATWSARQTVAPSGTGRVFYSQVVMSGDGSTVIATWNREDGSNTEVGQSRTARVGHGTPVWRATHDLSPAGEAATEEPPQVGISRDGSTAVAVWKGLLGNVRSRSARISSRGAATWAAVQDVSPAIRSFSRGVQVALSADGGTVMAVWAEEPPGGLGHAIRARTATISGGTADWGNGLWTLTGVGGSYAPHVAISSHGTTALVVWTSVSSSGTGSAQSRAASIDAGGVTWSPRKNLSAPVELTSVAGSDVALSADGTRAVAVWSIGSVLSRTARLTAGTPSWRKPTQLVSLKGGGPLVGMSRDGTAAVSVWNRYDGTGRLATYLQSSGAFAR